MFLSTAVLVADALLLRKRPFAVLRQLDWSVLVMFGGLFVWLEGFNRTHLPAALWQLLGIGAVPHWLPQILAY